jgi:hypothetical protein
MATFLALKPAVVQLLLMINLMMAWIYHVLPAYDCER